MPDSGVNYNGVVDYRSLQLTSLSSTVQLCRQMSCLTILDVTTLVAVKVSDGWASVGLLVHVCVLYYSISYFYIVLHSDMKQVAQLSQRDRAAVWVGCGANINVVFRIQRTLL